MNKLKIFMSFLILFSVLNCSKINQKIEEKVYEQQRETMRKIDSVMLSKYKDSVSKDMYKELKAIDSIRNNSDSTMKEIQKNMKKLNKKVQK